MMKSTFIRWLLILGLLLGAGLVHAEDGCPPGFVPTGAAPSPQDPVACRPMDDDNQQQVPRSPPPIWVSKWGAIATDFSHTSAGASIDEASQNSAEQAAITNCQSNGGVTCKVELTYSNGCSALAVGKTGHNAKAGATIAIASQAAMKVCSEADTGCFVYYTACSLPIRVQ